ncbi:MAG: hypothetical protein AB1797_05085 [bacterium]
MSSLANSSLRYITDKKGRAKEIVLPLKVWRDITEELDSLREKQKILFGLKQACQEVKMQKTGKLEEETLESFLNEL